MLDNQSAASVESVLAMRKWFISLVLLAALSGGVTAGVPMHSSMNEAMMDCCAAALARDDSPATTAARLCCALNCQEPGPTTATTAQTVSISPPSTVAVIPPVVAHDLNPILLAHSVSPNRRNIQPPYILNLALLI
ncbi:MAG: hypothetical protein ACREA9_07175 [Pyrinomonadaceae bacterium]